MKNIILICGPSCVGKSYYIDKLLESEYKGYVLLKERKVLNINILNKYIESNIIVHIDLNSVYIDGIHYNKHYKLLNNLDKIKNKVNIIFKILYTKLNILIYR